MSRSTYTFKHKLTAEQSEEIVTNFLLESKLKPMTLKTGEHVWRQGTGILFAARFLSVYYQDYKTIVMAWVQTGLGLTARSEADLYGVSQTVPKMQVNKVLKQLEILLDNAVPKNEPKAQTEEPEAEKETAAEAFEEEAREAEAAPDEAEADESGMEEEGEEAYGDDGEDEDDEEDDPTDLLRIAQQFRRY